MVDIEYKVYHDVVGVPINFELSHDRIDNGIVIHHIPKDTNTANSIINRIKARVHRHGYKVNFAWLDMWTLRVTWHD